MPILNEVDYTRHKAEIEIRFKNGIECCEWCNMSYTNMKRHFECAITHEEMVSPKDSIGCECPLRLEKSNGKS